MASERDEAAPGLRVHGLSVALGGRPVLRDLSFDVPKGTVTVVVAPSGSGKSTLLRCCNRLLQPDGGTVLLDGADVDGIEACALRRRVGLVGQVPVMLPGTVRDNLAYGLTERDDSGDAALARALAAAGLDASFLDRPADELSGGERARVTLARALTRGPELLLLDEPTAALDAAAAGHVGETLRRLAGDGLGVLAATHDLGFAAAVADRAITLRDGRAVTGTPEEILGGADAERGAERR
ncbi:ABC transporter ATP-binding protein [Conexibacter stalactiti]|uniref:ABC transporter ATP-binding protein n=1 Tax=Conexibacter stalactiti TaxID=1940611 RepID=A0ABU4HK89_9ACTN|nr:ABC transporter ATP-binding protein [Conexibacter stalactiti]MDW5593717.1 ABC transporter ATP-binding protein [Conexibacter stalactiti]MEC5034358.1 ABC transporter ATP-binding protein [Conexibacter stalactiti]